MFKRIKALIPNESLFERMVYKYKKENPLQKGFAYFGLIVTLVLAETTVGFWNDTDVLALTTSNVAKSHVFVIPTASNPMVNVLDPSSTVVIDENDKLTLSDDLVENEETFTLLESVVAPSISDNVISTTSKDDYNNEIAEKTKLNIVANMSDAVANGAVKSYEAKVKAEEEAKRLAEEKRKAEEAAKKAAALKAQGYVNNPNFIVKLTNEEYDLFCRLVRCEAGSEDEIGKILVANVVLNRMKARKQTLKEVIYAKNQFSPVTSGKINRVTYGQDVKTAVDKALSGIDYSKGAQYFYAPKYSSCTWFDEALTKVLVHGVHHFYI